jgi:spermidine synthase
MRARPLYFEAFLVALATILLEVSYTRVFSFKLVYYFTYLIIGIALLGLGAGGVLVAVVPRLRRIAIERAVGSLALGAAVSVLLGYLLVATTQLNAFDLLSANPPPEVVLREIGKLVLACFVVFVPFLCAGLALSTIFATQTQQIARLYSADLLGAAIGCAIVIPLLTYVTPPGTVLLSGVLFAAAGLRVAARTSRGLVALLVLAAAPSLVFAVAPQLLPDPIVDRVKTLAPTRGVPAKTFFSRWHPVFRVDVMQGFASYNLIHDGTIGSTLWEWDGERSSLERFDRDDRQLPFRLLPPGPKVAIVGAAGGHEILASIWFNASHVTGIELNPVTWSLVTKHFADYGGRLAELPNVDYVNAEGRSFLRGSSDRFDLIWLVAPDSYAAMNAATSGAFVLSESYLYTKEMIADSLDRLSPGGILCVQFGEVDFAAKPNRTLRYLATARAALRELGIPDFARHVIVTTSPGFASFTSATVLLRKTPFTPEDRAIVAQAIPTIPKAAIIHNATRGSTGLVSQVITLPAADLERMLASHPFAVGPISDDSPFFWHFVPFSTILRGFTNFGVQSHEEALGEKLLLVLLGVAVAFAAVFMLLPLLAIRSVWHEVPYKRWAGIYFAALGLGFMFLEVCLIQRFTLFLGYPTYSLTVTLFALLLSTGIGSLLSERWLAQRNRSLLVLGGALALLVAFYLFQVPVIVRHGMSWPIGVRAGITVVLLMPLGLCLGAMMPIGLRTVSAVTRHGDVFVAWSWAVNGFFSVVSSVLATILSMTIGFNMVLVTALVIYAIGIAALTRIPAPARLAPPSA